MLPPSLTHAISTATDGNMGLRFGTEAEVTLNRKTWLTKQNIDPNQVCLMDVAHEADIFDVTKENFEPNMRPVCDVLVIQEPNLALMLLTADCLPVTIYDPVTTTIALGHFNRHNIPFEIAKKTITHLVEHYGSNPADLLIHIGPCISADSYRFPLPLQQEPPPATKPYVKIKDNHAHVDVTRAHVDALLEVGVPEKQITLPTIDTATHPNYYSHFATKQLETKPDGRFATVVLRKILQDQHPI